MLVLEYLSYPDSTLLGLTYQISRNTYRRTPHQQLGAFPLLG